MNRKLQFFLHIINVQIDYWEIKASAFVKNSFTRF